MYQNSLKRKDKNALFLKGIEINPYDMEQQHGIRKKLVKDFTIIIENMDLDFFSLESFRNRKKQVSYSTSIIKF